MTTDLVGHASDVASAETIAPTAANAAVVLQVPVEPSSPPFPEHRNPTDKVPMAVVRHRSAAIYDRVFAMALPDVVIVAAHKNVPLLDGEAEIVLRDVLKDTAQKNLKLILQGDDEACWAVSLAISHAIDLLAAKRFIVIARITCEMPPLDNEQLILAAEGALKDRSANDKGLTIRIWRNPVEELADYIQVVFTRPMVTLPNASTVRVGVSGAPALRTDGASA